MALQVPTYSKESRRPQTCIDLCICSEWQLLSGKMEQPMKPQFQLTLRLCPRQCKNKGAVANILAECWRHTQHENSSTSQRLGDLLAAVIQKKFLSNYQLTSQVTKQTSMASETQKKCIQTQFRKVHRQVNNKKPKREEEVSYHQSCHIVFWVLLFKIPHF